MVAIIAVAAFLVSVLTLPLLSRSFTAFAVIAGCCWAAIFAAVFVMTRSLSRSTSSRDRSDRSEPFAQRAERIPDNSVSDNGRLERAAGSSAHAEERPN
jgi:hypothetical protein